MTTDAESLPSGDDQDQTSLLQDDVSTEVDDLEEYGVWVKVGPQEIEPITSTSDSSSPLVNHLEDADPDSSDLLTEEEEQLLGDLEDEFDESDAGDAQEEPEEIDDDDFSGSEDFGMDEMFPDEPDSGASTDTIDQDTTSLDDLDIESLDDDFSFEDDLPSSDDDDDQAVTDSGASDSATPSLEEFDSATLGDSNFEIEELDDELLDDFGTTDTEPAGSLYDIDDDEFDLDEADLDETDDDLGVPESLDDFSFDEPADTEDTSSQESFSASIPGIDESDNLEELSDLNIDDDLPEIEDLSNLDIGVESESFETAPQAPSEAPEIAETDALPGAEEDLDSIDLDDLEQSDFGEELTELEAEEDFDGISLDDEPEEIDLDELDDETLAIGEVDDFAVDDDFEDMQIPDDIDDSADDSIDDLAALEADITGSDSDDILTDSALEESPGEGMEADKSSSIASAESLEALQNIESELRSIKNELASLKSELSSLRSAPRVEEIIGDTTEDMTADTGFFDEDEDETIALTGDELDNILNTADITEETVEDSEVPDDQDFTDLEDDMMEDMDVGLVDVDISGDSMLESEDDDLELAALGDLDSEFEDEKLIDKPDIIPLDVPEEIDGLDAEPDELSLEDDGVDDIPLDLSLDEELDDDEIDLSALSSDGLGDELESLEDDDLEDIEIVSADSTPTAIDDVDLSALESVDDELDALEDIEDITYDTGDDVTEPLELEVEESDEDEIVLEPIDDFEDAESDESLEEIALDIEPASDEIDDFAASAEISDAEKSADIPDDIRTELRTVLSYLDQLLESLPEEKIQEFAQSEHFDVYKRLFEELGLAT